MVLESQQNGGDVNKNSRAPATLPHVETACGQAFPVFLFHDPTVTDDSLLACLSIFPDAPDAAVILIAPHVTRAAGALPPIGRDSATWPVVATVDGTPLLPGRLYVVTDTGAMDIAAGRFRATPAVAGSPARSPVTTLLTACARDYGTRLAVALSADAAAQAVDACGTVRTQGGLTITALPALTGESAPQRFRVADQWGELVLSADRVPVAIRQHLRQTQLSDDAEDRRAGTAWPPNSGTDTSLGRASPGLGLHRDSMRNRRVERHPSMTSAPPDHWHDSAERTRAPFFELATSAPPRATSRPGGAFRDPDLVACLERVAFPALLRDRAPDEPIRVWMAGCGTGEDAYAVAALLVEFAAAAAPPRAVQFIATDADRGAIDRAQDGRYTTSAAAVTPPALLARQFRHDRAGYRAGPELRGAMTFLAHDILTDPPFQRIDLLICRNLLDGLPAERRSMALATLHGVLRDGGLVLLLGMETIEPTDTRFESVSKQQRLFRRAASARAGGRPMPPTAIDTATLAKRQSAAAASASRQPSLATLCEQAVAEAFVPATVAINRRFECLYSIGPVDRYLRVVAGAPTNDLLTMVRPELRTRIRAAVHQACEEQGRVVLRSHPAQPADPALPFSVAVQPLRPGDTEVLLVSFLDDAAAAESTTPNDRIPMDGSQPEFDAVRAELNAAIAELEAANQHQAAALADALTTREELQNANAALVADKQALEYLGRELTAANRRLQDELETRDAAYQDLKTLLDSTNVATLFLGTDLTIRFFTPATKALFPVIPSDIGRPVADLRSAAEDTTLLSDATGVLETLAPHEREIQTPKGAWYMRRIQPYRAGDGDASGVVITFADITEQKQAAAALEEAKRQAEQANLAKSRFLAAASHDLRQPLQTLTLLEGLLAKVVTGEKAQTLVARLTETVESMSDMLNTLLDINQIEAGVVSAHHVAFPIHDVLDRIRDEFTYTASAQQLTLRVMPCSLTVRSDPRLLEQMVRNLLSNALKYTKHGRVLVGCRRHGDTLGIEVWDSGVGIPEQELHAIFEEYHQLDNAARNRSLGLGLGLSITRRLANLLDHRIRVRSQPGKGSVFAIDVPIVARETATPEPAAAARTTPSHTEAPILRRQQTGTILVIEDDPQVCELLQSSLASDGQRVAAAADGLSALDLVRAGTVEPDLILADYNLPNGMDGLMVAARMRDLVSHDLPVIILTGDISAGTMRDIAERGCRQLNKPVKLTDLTSAIQDLLPAAVTAKRGGAAASRPAAPQRDTQEPVVYVVDDDAQARGAIRAVLEDAGATVEDFASCEEFLAAFDPDQEACLVIDAYLPGMTGLQLLQKLRDDGVALPAIMVTANSDVSIAVHAMKAGAADFIAKPVGREQLLNSVSRVLELVRDTSKVTERRDAAASYVANLTPRQKQIMDMVLAGHPSKNIAADLGISQRTVENHRAAIMKKTGARSLPALARLALVATGGSGEGAPPR